jgi:hypothetical protein
MAYSLDLEQRIDESVGGLGLTKKKMFGGICYLLAGNMCIGIYKDYLIVRLGSAETAAPYLKQGHVRPMDITGRPMKGWVMVPPTGYGGEDPLSAWISRGVAFARNLARQCARNAMG